MAPLYVDPNDITPESVDVLEPEDVLRAGDALCFPKAYFCEVRADWKFIRTCSEARIFLCIRILIITKLVRF